MSLRSAIFAQFASAASDHGKQLAPLSDNLILLESGLDSLCFAVIVARLEEELGVDPFAVSEDIYLPITLGEFVKFYENATA
jgi:acyl carrier protein